MSIFILSKLFTMEAIKDDAMVTVRPRKRQSHIKARQRKVLEKMEASQVPMEPTVVESDETSDNGSSTTLSQDESNNCALTYNLPDPNDANMEPSSPAAADVVGCLLRLR